MCNLSKGVAEKATAKGLQQGLQQGLEQARTEALSNLMSEMNLTLDQAMKVLKIPADEQAKYEAILKKQTLRLVFSKQGRDAYLLIQQAASLPHTPLFQYPSLFNAVQKFLHIRLHGLLIGIVLIQNSLHYIFKCRLLL